MSSKKKWVLLVVVLVVLIAAAVALWYYYTYKAPVSADVSSCQLVNLTPSEQSNYKAGELGHIYFGVTNDCNIRTTLDDGRTLVYFHSHTDLKALDPNVAVFQNATSRSSSLVSGSDIYYPWVLDAAIYGVNPGTAEFSFTMHGVDGEVYDTHTETINVAAADTSKMQAIQNKFAVINGDGITYRIIRGTGPYTFEPTSILVPNEAASLSWTTLDATQMQTAYDNNISPCLSFNGNTMSVTCSDQVMAVTGNITDSTGRQTSVAFYTLHDQTRKFADSVSLAVGEKVQLTFDDLMGSDNLSYVTLGGWDNLGLVERTMLDDGNIQYTYQGLKVGSGSIIPWNIRRTNPPVNGEEAWLYQTYGVMNFDVTSQDTACASGQVAYTFTPSSWNIKTNNFTSSANKIYDVFSALGQYPVRIFAYTTAGTAYTENPVAADVAPGNAYWFNSSVEPPICLDDVTANTNNSVTINKSLAMVGNMTTKTKTWGDARITVNGETMTLAEAARQSTPIVKAMFLYSPGAESYNSYYAPAYSDYVAQGFSMDDIASVEVAPGNGGWIALNSSVSSATISF